MEDAKKAQNSRGGTRFVALLLVSATAAAAMTVLMYCFSSTGGTPIASAFSAFMGTGRARNKASDVMVFGMMHAGMA